MPNEFLSAVDRWLWATVREKMVEAEAGAGLPQINAADVAQMISDYVLLRVAQEPNSCWTACDLDFAADAQIMGAIAFSHESLAASFIGAACELAAWQGDEGVRVMIEHGVEPDDATEIAAAVDVVMGKLGARGQVLIQQLNAAVPSP